SSARAPWSTSSTADARLRPCRCDAMKWIKQRTNIDFLSRKPRLIALGIAIAAILVSTVSLATRGLAFGLDFTGGVLLEVSYPEAADIDGIRTTLEEAGFEDAQVQRFGADTDVLLRLPPQPDQDNPNRIRDRL